MDNPFDYFSDGTHGLNYSFDKMIDNAVNHIYQHMAARKAQAQTQPAQPKRTQSSTTSINSNAKSVNRNSESVKLW